MSKGIKWAEEAQDDMKIDLAEILGDVNKRRNNIWQAQRRFTKHKLSNTTTEEMQWCGRNTN